MGICLMVVPLEVPNGDLSNGCTSGRCNRGSVVGCTPGSARADYE